MEIPRHWRLRRQRYKLVGEICTHCETKIFPPRDICPECGQYIIALSQLFEPSRPKDPSPKLKTLAIES